MNARLPHAAAGRCASVSSLVLASLARGLCSLALLLPTLALSPPANAQNAPPKRSAADHGGKAHAFFTRAHMAHRGMLVRGANGPTGAASPNDLTYHGGSVMRDVTNYVIIWNPPGSTFGANYQRDIEQYFHDVGGTPFMTINSQYGDSTGVAVPNTNHFGGTWVDTANAYPHAGTVADPINGSDIRDEVDRAIAANPTWQAPGLSTMYFVYLGQNIIECFKGSGDTFGCFAGTDSGGNTPPAPSGNPNTVAGAATYCAYHSSFGAKVYATMPYAGSSTQCGNNPPYPNSRDTDLVISPTSHEQFEAYSDPNLDAWYNDTTGNENGDNCAYNYGPAPAFEPDGTNMVFSGHRYQTQLEWSNGFPGGCIKRAGADSQPTLSGSLAFGTVARGSSASRDVLVQNTAAGDLNLLNVRLAAGAAASGFTLSPSTQTWGTLRSGESLLVTTYFTPSASLTTSGPFSTTLIVDTDQPGFVTQNVAATGTAGLPRAAITAALNFGTVCNGSTTTLPITVTNTGQAPLTVSSIALSGASPGLSIVSTPSVPQTIAVGGSLTFKVAFAPGAGQSGNISGNVVVTTDDPGNPVQSFPISGSAGTPAITLGSSALDFQGVPTDDRTSPNAADRTITIGNTGSCALNLNALVLGGTNPSDFSIVGAPSLPVSIANGSALTLTVRFNPTAPGARSAVLSIGSNDLTRPSVSVPLTGLGLIPSILTSTTSMSFAPTVVLSQAPGFTGLTQPLKVTNTGQAELVVDVLSTSGSPFQATPAASPPSRFAPSDSFNEPITFAPTAVGKFTGSFSVADSNPQGPASSSVSLCGEGVMRGIRVLAVSANGTPIAQVSKLMLKSQGTAQNINVNVQNLSLAPVPTSCDPSAKRHYENQSLPATGTVNQRSSYYTLSATAGGKSTTVTFTLGVAEFKTILLTIK
jgi:hypothetical protein